MIVGIVACTALLISYYTDLGEGSNRKEFKIVVLAGIAELMLAWGIYKSFSTPGIVTALQNPEGLESYRLIMTEEGNVGIVWLHTKDGQSYEVPIMGPDVDSGNKAFEALMKHAPHLVEKKIDA